MIKLTTRSLFRSHFRFSLRLLLIAILVVASFFAGWSARDRRLQQAARNITQLQSEARRRRDVLVEHKRRRDSPAYQLLAELRGGGVAELPYILEGVIVARRGDTVALPFGTDDGIGMGGHVFVFHHGQIIACLEITKAGFDSSAGRIVLFRSSEAVAVGNRVVAYVGL